MNEAGEKREQIGPREKRPLHDKVGEKNINGVPNEKGNAEGFEFSENKRAEALFIFAVDKGHVKQKTGDDKKEGNREARKTGKYDLPVFERFVGAENKRIGDVPANHQCDAKGPGDFDPMNASGMAHGAAGVLCALFPDIIYHVQRIGKRIEDYKKIIFGRPRIMREKSDRIKT